MSMIFAGLNSKLLTGEAKMTRMFVMINSPTAFLETLVVSQA